MRKEVGLLSNEGKPQVIAYFGFNSKEQLSTRRDRSKWHLKNIAKQKAYGSWKVNSMEQRLAVKRRCEEFDRDNRVTMEDMVAALRKFMHGENCYLSHNKTY